MVLPFPTHALKQKFVSSEIYLQIYESLLTETKNTNTEIVDQVINKYIVDSSDKI